MEETQKKPLRIVEKRNFWFFISFTVILIGFLSMGLRGLNQSPLLNFGIDFTGGTSFILKFDALNKKTILEDNMSRQDVNAAFIREVRSVLDSYGLEKSQIQISQDKEVLIRTLELTQQSRKDVLRSLEERLGVLELLEIDIIGPTIGAELREQSLWIVLIISIVLLIYISWRFEFVFGLAALSAIFHDALVIISAASLLSIEINTAFVAALLTILGYSLNDTIVIFDRIRENVSSKSYAINDVVNLSAQQMLTRSFHTSFTTLLVIGSLILFGGTVIKGFSTVLFVGVISGTYSSICIASPIIASLYKKSDA